jgi:serine/threonine-protein kinase
MTQGEARDALTKAGLVAGGDTTTADHPTIAKDKVITSDPEAGASVPKGTEVALVISTGEVELPDLKGKTYLEARDLLLSLGLGAESKPQEDGTVAVDTVLAQDPAPGSVEQGTTVTLTIATAPPPPTETTPPPTETEPPPTETEPPGLPTP